MLKLPQDIVHELWHLQALVVLVNYLFALIFLGCRPGRPWKFYGGRFEKPAVMQISQTSVSPKYKKTYPTKCQKFYHQSKNKKYIPIRPPKIPKMYLVFDINQLMLHFLLWTNWWIRWSLDLKKVNLCSSLMILTDTSVKDLPIWYKHERVQ